MAAEAEWEDRLFKQAATIAASAAQAATKDGTIPSLGREAVKDLRNTIHEIFFGCGEGMSEPGTPLNPTPGEIADDRREDMHPYGSSRQNAGQPVSPASPAATVATSPLPSAGDIAHDRDISPLGAAVAAGTVHGQEQRQNLPNAGDIANDRDGQVLTQEEKGWRERMEERRQQNTGGSDGYDRQKERIKPEEERRAEREKERERGDFGR